MTERRFPLALLGLWVAVLLLLFRPQLHGMDTVAYYAWLRSTVIQGNLDASDEFERYGYRTERGVSSTGYRINEWPVGPALLWAPFFLAAHLLVRAANGLGIPIAADGYSAPYLTLTALGSAVYALIGLELLRRMAGRVVSPAAAFWGTITAWLASPLVFYMSAHPFMAHAADFFVNAWFLGEWAGSPPPALRARLRLGLIGGLAASVRYQNATLLIWPALEDLAHLPRAPRAAIGRLLGLGVGAGIGFFPQMIAWRVVFGRWIVGNPYSVAGVGSLDWHAPHVLDVLFSTDRGLFVWTPIAPLALIGILQPLRSWRPAWARFLIAQGLAQVYIVGSWSAWSGAAAFGPRLLIGLVPAFALGLAALFEAIVRRWGARPVAACSLAAIVWNLILLARYGLQDIPRMGPVPLTELWLGQFTFLLRLIDGWGGASRLELLIRALQRQGP